MQKSSIQICFDKISKPEIFNYGRPKGKNNNKRTTSVYSVKCSSVFTIQYTANRVQNIARIQNTIKQFVKLCGGEVKYSLGHRAVHMLFQQPNGGKRA